MVRRARESHGKAKRTNLEKSLAALAELGKEDYWVAREGKNIIRILPPWNEEGVFFFKGILHYGVRGESSAPVPCRESIERDCPICKALERVEDKEIRRRLSKRTRFYMNIIDRGNPGVGVKIFGCSMKQMRQLRSQMEDPDFGDITDPEEGHDIIVEKDSQTNPAMPNYDIRVRPKATPLDYDTWEEELYPLDQVVVPEIPTEEEYEEIAQQLLEDLGIESKPKKRVDDDEEEDEDEGDNEDDDGDEGARKKRRGK